MTWRIRWDEIRVDTGHRKRKTDAKPGAKPGAREHSPAPDGDVDAPLAISPTGDEGDAALPPPKQQHKKRKESKSKKEKEKGKRAMKNGSLSFSQKLMQRVARVRSHSLTALITLSLSLTLVHSFILPSPPLSSPSLSCVQRVPTASSSASTRCALVALHNSSLLISH